MAGVGSRGLPLAGEGIRGGVHHSFQVTVRAGHTDDFRAGLEAIDEVVSISVHRGVDQADGRCGRLLVGYTQARVRRRTSVV